MKLPDVNILIHALRPDADQHDRCRDWLDHTAAAIRPFAVTGVVLSGVVRVLTHPQIFSPPSQSADVMDELDRLLSAPRVVNIAPGPRHWHIFCDLIRTIGASGNLIPDAWLAAIAIEHGCTLVSLDTDFQRFPGLDIEEP